MSSIAILILCFLITPALVFAQDGAQTRYLYPAASIFAWGSATCPNGATPIHDPVYADAGRLSGVVYCLFPSPDIAVSAGARCPLGFEPSSKNHCIDRRARP